MNIRAVICDVYHTLLALNPPAQDRDAETRWAELWRKIIGGEPNLSFTKFSIAVQGVIAREHAAARGAGVAHPEVFWPDILRELLPELERLSPATREEFLWQQAQQLHTVHLMPGAAEALQQMRAKNLILGLASNAQPYTLRELDAALSSAGLSREIFNSSLCFFSFEHGFSKPDRAVFRFLGERLQAKGILPGETIMIGNRLDNDIHPARAEGWQTWHLTPPSAVTDGPEGDWEQFSRWLG